MKHNRCFFFKVAQISILLFCLFSCNKNEVDKKVVDVLGDAQFLSVSSLQYPKYLKRGWEGCPAIDVTENGEMFIARFAGFTQEGPNNFIVISYSPDKGRSWMNNKLIIAPTKVSDRYFDPMLFKDSNKNVVLVFSRCENLSGVQTWDGRGGVWATKLGYDNFADTITYTPPFFLFDGVMNNKPTINLDITRPQIIFPVAVWAKGIYVYGNNFTSVDNFRPTFFSTVTNIPNPLWYSEPSIISMGQEGGYTALIRSNSYGIVYAKSSDLKNWSTIQVFNKIGDNADARHFSMRLNSGNLLFVVNASAPPKRATMTAFLSTNNGVSCDYKLVIDSRKNTSYPDGIEDEEGNIYITYDFERTGKKEINYVKFTEADVIAGRSLTFAPVNINSY